MRSSTNKPKENVIDLEEEPVKKPDPLPIKQPELPKQVCPTKKVNGSLLGLHFCVNGTFKNIHRKALEELITKNKGKLHSTITGKTDFLIIGDVMEDGRKVEDGKKYQKAKKLCTRIMKEDEFEKYLKLRFKNPEYLLGQKIQQVLGGDHDQQADDIDDIEGQMWTEKYKPKKIGDLVGNKDIVDSFREWLVNWEENP